ncbi:MAG TPA: hypothetical protein VD994_02805 [Prosthecobacter sp.]|nr:hypothetical protein [Prosthecobacter sp.]
MTSPTPTNRALTREERHLVRWMLEQAGPDAAPYLPQLERAQVLPTRCPCGCASLNFSIDGQTQAAGSIRPLADFVFGDAGDLSGIFVFEQSGVLGGVEVYGLAGEAPKTLPSPDLLRPFP